MRLGQRVSSALWIWRRLIGAGSSSSGAQVLVSIIWMMGVERLSGGRSGLHGTAAGGSESHVEGLVVRIKQCFVVTVKIPTCSTCRYLSKKLYFGRLWKSGAQSR